MTKRIYLSSPYTHGEEMQFVKEAFDTNWLAPVGKNIDGLEADINAYINKGVRRHLLCPDFATRFVSAFFFRA